MGATAQYQQGQMGSQPPSFNLGGISRGPSAASQGGNSILGNLQALTAAEQAQAANGNQNSNRNAS